MKILKLLKLLMRIMKKTTIISKRQILMVTMVLALGAAVWLNVKYATDGTGFGSTQSISDAELGNAKYVANTNVVSADEEEDYFTKAKKEREESRKEETELLEKTLKAVKSTEDAKLKATEQMNKITDRMEMENSIETLIKAKGFKDSVAVLSDDSCSIVVKKSSELEKNETVQILDIVNSITKINLENIKIVSVK